MSGLGAREPYATAEQDRERDDRQCEAEHQDGTLAGEHLAYATARRASPARSRP